MAFTLGPEECAAALEQSVLHSSMDRSNQADSGMAFTIGPEECAAALEQSVLHSSVDRSSL